jgi:2'-5' RNA ligase
LTLGRVREGAAIAAARAAGESVERSPTEDYGDIRVDAIYLMRSDLRPTGAVYSRMAEIPLRGLG